MEGGGWGGVGRLGDTQRQRDCEKAQKKRQEEGTLAVGPLLRRWYDIEQAAPLYGAVRPALSSLSSSLTDSYLSDCECNNSTNNLSSRAQLNWL